MASNLEVSDNAPWGKKALSFNPKSFLSPETG